MRCSTSFICLLSLACCLGGCSQTAGVRSSPPSGLTTVASVGDKPLPIVAGEPGASLRAETEQLDRPTMIGSRISGRVYDDRGKPVPSAKVRLAVGSAAGGKVVVATTDRSGAFTLHGLRSGTAYTLIAEYRGEDGTQSGRAQAKAPQADVRIALQSRDEPGQGHSSIRPARPRVDPISNVDPADDEPADENGAADRMPGDDLEPPADEAATLLPRRTLQASRASSDTSLAGGRSGWNARQSASHAGAGAGETSAGRAPEDDAGANPRPARLTTKTWKTTDPIRCHRPLKRARSARRGGLASHDQPVRVARGGRQSASSAPRGSGADLLLDRDETKLSDLKNDAAEETPARFRPSCFRASAWSRRRRTARSSLPTRRRPAAHEALPPGARGLRGAGGISADGPRGRGRIVPRERLVPGGRSRRKSSLTAADLARSIAQREQGAARRSAPARAGPADPAEKGVITLTSTSRGTRAAIPRLLASPRPVLEEAVKQSVCRIDPTERRLVDFKLPDLNGKLVSLHDFDADLILLDFWGSWCPPCRKSVPHLLDLQSKLAGKRFQVVGIACEKAAAPADRRAAALKAMHELGITYPVLLSGMDGSCPVQQALQIQFYPTLVLVDREGRLLAREQGATDATLPRMDRAVASALRSPAANPVAQN